MSGISGSALAPEGLSRLLHNTGHNHPILLWKLPSFYFKETFSGHFGFLAAFLWAWRRVA
jgi:hypothetical protein